MKELFAITLLSVFVGQMAAEAGEAKAYPNAPRELIGKYGNSPVQCQSYHRKSDNLTSISATSYEFCGGSMCGADIVSHQKLKDGYILKLKGPGNPSGWRKKVKVLDNGVIEVTSLTKPGPPETLARCTKADAIAGIGLRPDEEPTANKSLSSVFAAYYALAVPGKCAGVGANTQAAEAIIAAGRASWTEFLRNGPNSQHATPEGIADDVAREKADAEYAVRADAAEIGAFCSEVLGAFGDGGRVAPNLLKDPRGKT
ncbi:hypothetical protein [Bradyrhizobium sp. B117]|uniref:hypothetical protein n=1 Tax=Bradyrhizobium sp. B117 TaxID=3140246 RepID=UPI003184170C